ncbi:MAG: FAD:protein FMN transferase [Magnetococcus sp. DMHC-6]
MTPLRYILLTTLFLLLTACAQESAAPKSTTQLRMGTLVTITTWGVPDNIEQQAVTAGFQEIERIEQLMSRHLPNSPLSQINGTVDSAPHPIPHEIWQVLNLGIEIDQLSQGAFDMGLLALTKLWGFSEEPPPTTPPAAQAINNWLKNRPSPPRIVLKEPDLLQLDPQTGLDLGAIAKGYAIDQAIATLRAQGVENAIVNAGGNLRIIGSKGGKPWRVGVQHPRDPSRVTAVSLLSGDIALVTSGDYERFFLFEGQRYHHILDPKTGYPAKAGLISVSIQCPEAITADALSTAIFVLGQQKGLELINKHFPNCAALLIDDKENHLQTEKYIGQWLTDR